MPKTKERYEHGLHNEDTCTYLNYKPEFKDWVITTAFYSALHFVASKIFPFSVPAIEGKKTEIASIDQYYNYSGAKKRNISKHELMLELVEKNFDEKIANHYDWLMSAASTARYSHYQQSHVEISNRAISYLGVIKKACA